MDSKRLSLRAKQPGHDVTYRLSELTFAESLRRILRGPDWEIYEKPGHLKKIICGRYGIVPEVGIRYVPTNRWLFFEVKKQGGSGNAEERAAKHHTVQFYKELNELFHYDYHPFVTIMCEALATEEKYTLKHKFYFEPDHYFCWVDYDFDGLQTFILRIVDMWLKAPDGSVQGEIVPD